MAWCEGNGVDFLFGLARNARLVAEIATELDLVAAKSRRSGRPERRFKTFMWTTRRTWSRRRRVVAKAEWTKGEANPRFVVTSLRRDECKAKYLYEKVYCARGEMENRIKECQLDLYADRTSAATMRANQLRLWFYSMAYVLLCALRRRAARYRLRQRHLRHHPSQAAQDRSARARQRPPHQDRHGIGLSGRARLGTRRNPARNRRHRPRLPGMTRAAPARSLRGTTHRPTETQKIADIDSALRRHEHPRRRTSSRQNRLTPCPIHQ
jgi:Transposase DDE domain group 1